MTSFYEELSKGASKNIALQKAKISYIQTASDKVKAHPYFWAAFVAFGDTSPILAKGNSSLLYISFFILMILLGGTFLYLRGR